MLDNGELVFSVIANAVFLIICFNIDRILGGIPTILPWWPIKPYRPCPNFIARGGQYSRIGQPLDEIAFGRGETNLKDEDDDF